MKRKVPEVSKKKKKKRERERGNFASGSDIQIRAREVRHGGAKNSKFKRKIKRERTFLVPFLHEKSLTAKISAAHAAARYTRVLSKVSRKEEETVPRGFASNREVFAIETGQRERERERGGRGIVSRVTGLR